MVYQGAHRDILRSGAPHAAARFVLLHQVRLGASDAPGRQRRAPMGMGRGLCSRRRRVVERHPVPRQTRLLIPHGKCIGPPAPDCRRESRNQVDSSWRTRCTRFTHLMYQVHRNWPGVEWPRGISVAVRLHRRVRARQNCFLGHTVLPLPQRYRQSAAQHRRLRGLPPKRGRGVYGHGGLRLPQWIPAQRRRMQIGY